jgi:putative endonuclease
MFTVYILYSGSLKKHYVGQCEDIEGRLLRHNSGGVRWTKNGIPWTLSYKFPVETRSLAVQLERKIKKRGAKRYLEDIKFGV